MKNVTSNHVSSVINVDSSQGPYKILSGQDILDRVGEMMRAENIGGNALLIVDEAIFEKFSRPVHESLEAANFETHVFVQESGEQKKTLEQAVCIYEWLSKRRAERCDCIVALGGGVIGDLAGFVAATWMRGISIVHIPSTLTAMVDSSIGGKTAINLPFGKNMVGAFHNPKLVLQDPTLLQSLSPRQLTSGWAETIKHALIADFSLLEFMEVNAKEIMFLDSATTVEAVLRSSAIKAQTVSDDEFEGGRRAMLNYGHTIGHALETITGYSKLLHGEAVAIGMTVAARISEKMGLISHEDACRQEDILTLYGLPVSVDSVSVDLLFNAMMSDKKSIGGVPRWVLLKRLGCAQTGCEVPNDVVMESINSVIS